MNLFFVLILQFDYTNKKIPSILILVTFKLLNTEQESSQQFTTQYYFGEELT